MRFASGRDPNCSEDVTCSVADADGPGFASFEEDGDTVSFCISDADGIDGPVRTSSPGRLRAGRPRWCGRLAET